MAKPFFDRHRAIKILVDAAQLGDAKACSSWKISRVTLHNYRKRLASDPELERAFAILNAKADSGWKLARTRFLKKALERVTHLLDSEKNVDKISRAIERIGNLDVASEALSASARSNQPSEASAGDAEGVREVDPESVDRATLS